MPGRWNSKEFIVLMLGSRALGLRIPAMGRSLAIDCGGGFKSSESSCGSYPTDRRDAYFIKLSSFNEIACKRGGVISRGTSIVQHHAAFCGMFFGALSMGSAILCECFSPQGKGDAAKKVPGIRSLESSVRSE